MIRGTAPGRGLVPVMVVTALAGLLAAAPGRAAPGQAEPGPSSSSAMADRRLPADLQPSPDVLASLSEAGLVGSGEPVAPFAWTLEVKRPMRDPRVVSERFLGSPGGTLSGLSPMLRHYGSEAPMPGGDVRPVLSVRGLTTLRPGEERADIEIRGLRLPLVDGAVFRLDWHDDGATLSQTCTVAGKTSAGTLHPAIPGDLHRIVCEGNGRYKGIPVGVSASVFYLERLGVFVRASSTLRTPLGSLASEVRVIDFSATLP